MTSQPSNQLGRYRRIALAVALIGGLTGFAAVRTNVLGAADRFDHLTARIERFVDPPPDRPTLQTVVVTPRPSTSAPAEATAQPVAAAGGYGGAADLPSRAPVPAATPAPVRAPVDVELVADPQAVFTSQLTNEWCAVAGTQMVLTILGLGNTSAEFQNELASRIGEWESWEDSHDGGWGPAAMSQALAAYGAPGYQIRAYAVQADALRDAAIALSITGKPVVLMPWWGAHTWVVTGYRADADPTLFPDATVGGPYILDPWYPRVSTIWGASDGPGNFEDAAEMQRNFIPWSRPEGTYPERDGTFVVLLPTNP